MYVQDKIESNMIKEINEHRMIDGKTLFEWWEECWPDLPRWGWDTQPLSTQCAFNTLAERINAEMGRPLILEEGAIQVNLPDLCKPGAVIEVAKIPPITTIQAQRVPGALREKVYDASREWWLTQLSFTTPVDDAEAEKIKQLSKDTYKAAVENTLVVLPEATYKKAVIHSAKFLGPIPMSAPMENPDHSTHHKSCALRHNGITCTCP